MNEQQLMLTDMVDRLFGAIAASRPEHDDGAGDFAGRWTPFETSGLQELLTPEAAGGFGGGGIESWLVCHAAGRHAIDLPVIEAIVGTGLLAAAGLAVPAGVLSIAARTDGEVVESAEGMTFTGIARGIPWGRHADHVVGLIEMACGRQVICLETTGATIDAHVNAAGEPRDEIRFVRAKATSAPHAGGDMISHGALARAAQIAGASRGALDLAITHVTDRSQFGKTLAKFQAVQHSLATLAEQVSATEAASRAAYASGAGLLETASAKIVANLASEAAVAIAHQMHGAMGFTWEYALHHRTRRLIAWGAEFGTIRHWESALGALAAEQGADAYWAFLVSGTGAGR